MFYHIYEKIRNLKKKKSTVVSIILIISSIILAFVSIIFAFTIHLERSEFLDDEDIHFERFSVKTEDDIEIKGFLYVDEDLERKDTHSVPTILLLHGINGRKEHKFDKVFQLVKLGYAVISVEQRGHGESSGISSFLDKEPEDMEAVIEYIDDNFKFSNSRQIALLGFSYGGGIGAILQATDNKVYASVLYHPLVSIEHLIDMVPFQNLVGITFGRGNIENIKDGLDICSSENTANMLLIHGEDDEILSKADSEELYNQVNGNLRSDIALEIRPRLNHFETEVDDESFKYALAWLEHLYHDPSIDITNLDEEISRIKFHDFEYPESSIPDILILFAAILFFLGISLLLLTTKIFPLSNKSLNIIEDDVINDERDLQKYKKMVLIRVILYIIPVVILAPLFAIFNPSYLFGYALVIPLTTIILFVFLPRFESPDWKSRWKSQLKSDILNWYHYDSTILLYGLVIVIGSVLFYVGIFNLNAYLMMSFPIPFFNNTMLLYLTMAISTFLMDYLLIRGLKIQHTILLIGLRSLTLIIFFLFIPIPAFSFTGLPISGDVAQILIFSLIGLVFWIVIMLMLLFKMIYKNIIPVILIFTFPLIVFLLFLYLRIV